MTLLETERLVRKISDLLQQVGNPAIAPKLAEDFAGACHATSLRLQQCEAMIKAGDRHQAIQLAETQPNLLDLVTILEFRGADDWRNYCQQNSLPAADRIDSRAVQALNAAYAQGITTDHPLYAAYRRAVLTRNDEEALKTLQSIVRLNPADSNAVAELSRLDAKVLATRLQNLENLLGGADARLLVAEIETIETFGFKNSPNGDVWKKAQTIRCGCLLEEAAALKNSAGWINALVKLDFVQHLRDGLKLDLPPTSLKQLDVLEAWAHSEQEKDKMNREFQALIGELHHKIHQSEEKDTSARFVKLPELRDDYEGLHKVWRSLTDFTRPIPEDAASAFRKREALLEAEITRRTSIRLRVILASSAAILIVGGTLVWFVMGQIKARDFARQIEEAAAQRQVHVAERLLERVRTKDQNLLGASRVNAAVAAAETLVKKEQGLLANFESAFARLPQQLTGEPDTTRLAAIADQLTLARNSLSALAPDLKTENEPRLQGFEKQWQKYLSQSGVAVNSLLDRWINSAEKQSEELDYRATVEKTTSQISKLSDVVQKIRDCQSGFTNHLSLRGDLLQRFAAVESKFTTYERELKKLNDGMGAIRKAHTLKEFSEGVNLMASSEFSLSPEAAAAMSVQSLHLDDESTVRLLLNATNAVTWAFIQKEHPNGFIPEAVMPAERQILQQISNDPAASGSHRRYRFWLDQEGTKSEEWITSGALDDSSGWKHIPAWASSMFDGSATFVPRDYGYFDGKYKLSATQPVYRFEELGSLNETASIYSIGLQKVLRGGSSYDKSLLEVLDSIKDSREGSPLFRGYIFLRLADLMNLQPDAWGLSFCPAVQTQAAQIKIISGGQLNSGDWFVNSKVNASSDKLNQFFASVKAVSFTKQAAGLLALAQEASKDGLRYAGFVGLDGKPALVEEIAATELWGYSLKSKQPIRLAVAGSDQIMPLSPLFALARPSGEYLSKASVNRDDPCFHGVLPPFFEK